MMTVEYRDYFLGKLQEMFNEWAADKEGTPNVASKKIASFEDKYMKNITGQLPVRQELFRVFIRELVETIGGMNMVSVQDHFIEGDVVYLTADEFTDEEGNTIYSLTGNWNKFTDNEENTIYELIN